MFEQKHARRSGDIGDTAVKARTGKTWAEWFAILDGAGATRMSHKEIVAYLGERHQVPEWWQQMVTITYDQSCGLREKHETPGGFQVSVTKTISVPVDKLFEAWQSEGLRVHWMPDRGITIRKATPNKSLRIGCVDGKTSLDVLFYARGEKKSQVSVQHSKLASNEEVETRRVNRTRQSPTRKLHSLSRPRMRLTFPCSPSASRSTA